MDKRLAPVILVLVLTLMACAGFTYKYYGLDVKAIQDIEHGSLLGPEEKDDLPLSVCKPVTGDESPCTCLLTPEFYKMRRDYIEIKRRLEACEGKPR